MFLEDYKTWYKKIREYENIAIEKAKEDADAIVVARAISWALPPEKDEKIKATDAVEEVIFDGANPRAGQIVTTHKVKILEVISGAHHKNDVIEVVVMEPEYFASGKRCSEPSYESVTRVDSFDNTFKYLMYLKGKRVLRLNMFVEWPDSVTAEEEYERLKP